DEILAIDGHKVSSSYDLLNRLQERRVLMIVQRDQADLSPVSWKDADANFEKLSDREDLQAIVSSIGLDHPVRQSGRLVLLNSVAPKPLSEISSLFEKQREYLEKNLA